MSSHNINPFFLLQPPLHLPLLSTHRSHFDSQFFPPSSDHILLLLHSDGVLFYSAPTLISQLFPSTPFPCILRHLLYCQARVKRSGSRISHARFGDSLSPAPPAPQLLWTPEIRKGSAGIISRPEEEPVKCLLITLLCALSRTLSSDHTNRARSLEMQSFTGGLHRKHPYCLSSRHSWVWTIVNNSDIPASLS